MEWAYLCIVIFLFVLATIDLTVGVSNDAVNFLSSAVGSKAASLKVILFIAAVGVFLGASLSNGMMDIARHGIFLPEHFYFREVMCIFLSVVISDVILLDIFNTLGLPTSTTVSMVFELLGASCIMALIKLASDETGLSMADLINTEKALTVIIGIFLSVAIAFFFGTIVQWLSRLFFTYNYKRNLGKKIGFFGSIAATSIIYFMLIKGLKGSSFMSAEFQTWLDNNVLSLLGICFVFFFILMQTLHWLKVNVFKVIVLMGTFSLAMAFAGNDLVNFIGVTLAGYSSYMDFSANANGLAPDQFLMTSLMASAKTPVYFLIGAGTVMVIALTTSKKAKKVLNTSIGLSRQDGGDEMFGTSSVARNLVRTFSSMAEFVVSVVPDGAKAWINKRFEQKGVENEADGAAFDLVRASVNLVLAGLLIAVGTSLKLPLSTTYVTFMVAMGSSLADRAWGRESAVYRVTGVISVVGGWFITAGAAFVIASILVLIMNYGGLVAMFCLIAVTVFIIVRSNVTYKDTKEKSADEEQVEIFLNSDNKEEVWDSLKSHTAGTLSRSIGFAAETYKSMFESFASENLKGLRRSSIKILEERALLKKMRSVETLGLRRVDRGVGYERNAWYHLSSNSCVQILNTLNRICMPMKDHTDNNFTPLSEKYVEEFSPYCRNLYIVFENITQMISSGDFSQAERISQESKALKKEFSNLRKLQTARLQDEESLKTAFVYLNLIQESHELLSEVRNALRGSQKFFAETLTPYFDEDEIV
ncbi:MAG: inorganic phosphate transporter [Paludibacteraceae bacterium]|nr:inorganic phosphate transporter [Paludibacteraceae bacterium]